MQISYHFDAYERSKIIFEKYSSAISGILINKIATTLEHAYLAKIKIL
jgi:hypothetical protein